MKIMLKEGLKVVDDVTISDDHKFKDVNGHTYKESDILSVFDNDTKKYVVCHGCGKVFRKSKRVIEKHTSSLDSRDCLSCRYMTPAKETFVSKKYSAQKDGTYLVTDKYTSKLYCRYGCRPRTDINSNEVLERCVHRSCTTNAIFPVEFFFNYFPGAFDDLITIDRINEAGYKDLERCGSVITFALKGKCHIVCTCCNGIVTHFTVSKRNKSIELMYSKKYKKFFYKDYSVYKEWNNGGTLFSDEQVEYIKKRISSLYE